MPVENFDLLDTLHLTTVLNQFVCTEEPNELAVIQKSIQDCIAHNPTDAIPVVCDYAVLVEGDESHSATLRNSVLDSLTNQFKPVIISSLKERPDALVSFTKAIINVSCLLLILFAGFTDGLTPQTLSGTCHCQPRRGLPDCGQHRT